MGRSTLVIQGFILIGVIRSNYGKIHVAHCVITFSVEKWKYVLNVQTMLLIYYIEESSDGIVLYIF